MRLGPFQSDHEKRWIVTGLVLIGIVGLCFLFVMRVSMHGFLTAQLEHAAVEEEQQGMALVKAELRVATKTLAKVEARRQRVQQSYNTEAQAELFFEQITVWASECRLTPISRVVNKPQPLTDPNSVFLVRQSADVALQGHVHNLTRFFRKLMERPQKVCLTNLHIALLPGESYEPRASFQVALVVNPSSEGKSL